MEALVSLQRSIAATGLVIGLKCLLCLCVFVRYELVLRPDQKQIEAEEVRCQYYVWDNVAIALQVDEQVLLILLRQFHLFSLCRKLIMHCSFYVHKCADTLQ